MGAERKKGWPRGVYFLGGTVCNVGIIVASELPRVRSTILIRIMAAGPGLADAIADLAALKPNAHERTVAEQILAHMQNVLAKKPSRSPEEEEFIVKMLKTWEHAREEGEIAASARALLTALRVRSIVVSEANQRKILAERDPKRLERWHERAIVASSIKEVFDESHRAA